MLLDWTEQLFLEGGNLKSKSLKRQQVHSNRFLD